MKASRFSPIVQAEIEQANTLRDGIRAIGPINTNERAKELRALLAKVYPRLVPAMPEIGLVP